MAIITTITRLQRAKSLWNAIYFKKTVVKTYKYCRLQTWNKILWTLFGETTKGNEFDIISENHPIKKI